MKPLANFGPRAIMAFTLAAIFVAALIPVALNTIFSVNDTIWDTSTIALWTILPLAIVGFVILKFVDGESGA